MKLPRPKWTSYTHICWKRDPQRKPTGSGFRLFRNLQRENEADQIGHAAEMTPTDTLIKFCLDNDVQKGGINELLEKGFDRVNTFKLVEAEDIRPQKIPIGQHKL